MTDKEQRVINAINALPGPDEKHLKAGDIFARQEYPRLSLDKLRWMLARMAHEGRIDRLTVGTKWHYYRQAKPEKKTTVEQLAAADRLAYTHALGTDVPAENQRFSIDAEVNHFFQTLYPLKLNKSVTLWMDTPQKLKNRTGASRKLLVLTPGRLAGLTPYSVVASVIQSGSCLISVDPGRMLEDRAKNVANLVLAGVPARLANPLMDTLRQVFKE